MSSARLCRRLRGSIGAWFHHGIGTRRDQPIKLTADALTGAGPVKLDRRRRRFLPRNRQLEEALAPEVRDDMWPGLQRLADVLGTDAGFRAFARGGAVPMIRSCHILCTLT